MKEVVLFVIGSIVFRVFNFNFCIKGREDLCGYEG